MKTTKKLVAAAAAAALTLTSLPADQAAVARAADSVDQTVRLQPWNASAFNDTNGDGLGEFEGWGTSLCWWANRIGYSEKMTSQAAELFFSDKGLDMNIGRYNIGGGDAVGETAEVPVNEKAQFYDLETEGRTPGYSGTSMKISEITALQNAQFSASDADFGFTKGSAVGTFQAIGYVNELGAAPGSGDNLHYTVNVEKKGTYTVKLLLTLTGSNRRNVGIRVNGTDDYSVDADTINANMIASGNNNMLFVATVRGVELNAGDNTVDIGGVGDWTLDFVKMAVISSGDEGVVPAEDEFTHAAHIIRSDSAVPGYAVDVTKIDTDQHSIQWYEDNFARADEDCGYAWNYDWDADENQMNVLKAAAEASGEEFIAEAFSNSPPYFMTVSGCSSGNVNANTDNLRADSVNAFAAYMADVIEHWNDEGVITFQSTTPMNEPYTNYWGAYSNKQEGCHFDQGESQSRIIEALNAELEEKGIDILISGTDETSIDTQIRSYNALSDEAKQIVDRIDTHTYGGSDRAGLKSLAESEGKNLWMSEVDGTFAAGTNAGEMTAALGLAQRMMTDVNGLGASAWILWNAIDMHSDSKTKDTLWPDSANDFASMDDLYDAVNLNGGYWGLAYADHDKENIEVTMKYYGFGQLSRYIRPGYTIIGTNRENTLAAYDPEGQKAVVVVMNPSDSDKTWKFDLSGFETMGTDITAIRTSGSMADGEKWADVTKSDNIAADTQNNGFTASVKANSITTYIIEGVSGIREDAGMDASDVKQIPVTADQVTGSTPWNGDQTNGVTNVIDNNYSTFFDGVLSGYVVFDLGEEKNIAAVGYAPRNGYADRCVGATIYGSNDGEDWTPLYTIDSVPAQNTDTFVYYTDFNTTEHTFRYIRYAQTESGNCNLSELKVYEPVSEADSALAAHYDMSHDGTALKDISGNGNDAVLYNTEDDDFAVYGEEEVLQFNNEQYATIPSGVVDDASSFTVQALVSATTTSDNWVWCFGDGIGEWGAGNIGDYIFVSANSAQGSYNGTVLGAVKTGNEAQGGESRMPVPDQRLGGGYTAITLVSDGSTLTLYMDGVEVSVLEHGKDVSGVIPDGDILGYIGQSLYSPDRKLIANVADIRIWDTALDAETVVSAVPSAAEKQNMLLADIQEALLSGNASADDIIGDVAFPASVDGVNLTWDIPENSSIAEDGKVTAPEADETVNVSVSYTCYGEEKTASFTLTVKGEDIDRILNEAEASLDIPDQDDIRGNITLPEQTENGVQVTWTTDHPEIVDVEAHAVQGYDPMPAGVVTRPAEDTEVKVTATLTYKEETRTKEFILNVKAAPKKIEDSDYTDYFFAYFAGEGYADGEQIYFASSQDGLNWDDLNNNKPVLTSTLGEKGVRDPFIIRAPEGDKFYLIATDLKINGGNGWGAAQTNGSQSLMVWESTDLVNWSDQRMVEVSADIEAGCTWAPEAAYDPLTGEYVVYWASKTADDGYAKQRVYYAKTRDFYTFTEPEVFIDYDESSIDTTIIQGDDGYYYRYTKNEGGATNDLGALTKTVFVERSKTLLGQWTHIPSDSLNANQWVEGPTIFKFNQEDQAAGRQYCLLVDNYGGGGYYPLVTDDLSGGAFSRPDTTYKMPSRARHGTPIRVTKEEYQRILAAYASPEEVNTATYMGETPELPDTVTIDTGSEEIQRAVTWNLDGVSFEGNPFSIVTVTGSVEGSTVDATANVQIIPENIEYMIDSNNPESATWENVKKLSSGLLNTDAADQQKTDDNTWGYTSIAGTDNSADITGYSQSSIYNPYTGGWWARGNKDITYQVTLPAGEHTILLGCTGWWNMGRQMDVFCSLDGGAQTKLCDFDAVSSQERYASGTITLDKETVVTLTVKKADNNDPILSWIAVCGMPSAPAIDLGELQEAVNQANALKAEDYTAGSYADVQTALDTASAQLGSPASQDAVDAAYNALQTALQNLVSIAELRDYCAEHAGYTEDAYTEESYAAYEEAFAAAEAVLGDGDATLKEVADVLAALQEAVEGLEKKPDVEVSKDELQKLYNQYRETEKGNYTEESYAALQDALERAAEVLTDENAGQTDVDEAANALKAAADALEEKPEEPEKPQEPEDPEKSEDPDLPQNPEQPAVNKDKLQDLYDSSKNIEQGTYTDASYQAYRDALKAAEAVLGDPDATQEEVSRAYSDLQDAVRGLTAGSTLPTEPSGAAGRQDEDAKDQGAVQTGDTTPVPAAAAAMLTALAAMWVIYRKRRSM